MKLTQAEQGRHRPSQLLDWMLVPLLLLVLAATVCAARKLFPDDFVRLLRFLAAMLGASLSAFPLSLCIFRRSPASALIYAYPLGLALNAYAVWTLAYAGIAPFSAESLYSSAVAVFILSLLFPGCRRAFAKNFRSPRLLNLQVLSALAFLLFFLLALYVRSLNPAARSLEKFMDLGFMNSYWRADWLPAQDIWFAGRGINYYSFGQYVYTALAKAAQVPPRFAYNPAFAAIFAAFALLAFAIGCELYKLCATVCRSFAPSGTKHGRRRSRLRQWNTTLAGLLALLYTSFAGNAHDLFIGTKAPGAALLRAIDRGRGSFGDLETYWYANATRYIGYNPPTNDRTIHEFPYYSFLAGDLHAHLCNTLFVLLFLALLLALLRRASLLRFARGLRSPWLLGNADVWEDACYFRPETRRRLLREAVALLFREPIFLLLGLFLGIFMMTNYWDFAIYVVVAAMLLFIAQKRALGSEASLRFLPVFLLQTAALFAAYLLIAEPVTKLWAFAAVLVLDALLFLLRPSIWSALGIESAFLFSLAHLAALPFNLSFVEMAKEIALVQTRTPIWQFLILYGPQLWISLIFALFFFARSLAGKRRCRRACALLASADSPVWTEERAGKTRSHGVDATAPPPVLRRLRRKSLIPERYHRRLDRRERRLERRRLRFLRRRPGPSALRVRPLGEVLLLTLLVAACGLILVPEFAYVVDIYQNGYARANTMFKFSYQAAILFGLVLPPAVMRIFAQIPAARRPRNVDGSQNQRPKKRPGKAALSVLGRALATAFRTIVATSLAAVLLGLLCYPVFATPQFLAQMQPNTERNLDAALWMKDAHARLSSDSGTDDEGDAGGEGAKNSSAKASTAAANSESANRALRETGLADDLRLIEWLNQSVPGQAVILEAAGQSYTDANRVSAYTGLPTPLGWETHEWLWRSVPASREQTYATVIAPRQEALKQVYLSPSRPDVRAWLRQEAVCYIVVGDIERRLYPELDEEGLRDLGNVVFTSGRTYLIEINPGAAAHR